MLRKSFGWILTEMWQIDCGTDNDLIVGMTVAVAVAVEEASK